MEHAIECKFDMPLPLLGSVEDMGLDYLVPIIYAMFRSIDWFISVVEEAVTLLNNEKVVPIRSGIVL